MIELGYFNSLKVVEEQHNGYVLDAKNLGEAFLAYAEVPEDFDPPEIGQEIEVFLFTGSGNKLMASLFEPLVTCGEFAQLEVVAEEKFGYFLEWGMPRDLLLPKSEILGRPKLGDKVCVYVWIDDLEKISATMKIEEFTETDSSTFKVGQEVEAFYYYQSDLGYKAVINDTHSAFLYSEEAFAPVELGSRTKVFIKNIREDGKIDLMQQKAGYGANKNITDMIMEKLVENNGFLPFNSKSENEAVHKFFGISKNRFKIAVGGLYKNRIIRVEDDGIYLNNREDRRSFRSKEYKADKQNSKFNKNNSKNYKDRDFSKDNSKDFKKKNFDKDNSRNTYKNRNSDNSDYKKFDSNRAEDKTYTEKPFKKPEYKTKAFQKFEQQQQEDKQKTLYKSYERLEEKIFNEISQEDRESFDKPKYKRKKLNQKDLTKKSDFAKTFLRKKADKKPKEESPKFKSERKFERKYRDKKSDHKKSSY